MPGRQNADQRDLARRSQLTAPSVLQTVITLSDSDDETDSDEGDGLAWIKGSAAPQFSRPGRESPTASRLSSLESCY